MSKIRIDLPSSIYDWYFVICDHVPHYYRPGPRCHYVGIATIETIYFSTGPVYWLPDLTTAQGFAQLLLANPDLISDCCLECHGLLRRTPSLPRFNSITPPRYPYLRPAYPDPYSPIPLR